MGDEAKVKVVAILCLTVVVLASIIGMTIAATDTDRDIAVPLRFTLIIALCIAGLGGLAFFTGAHRQRWTLERKDNGDDEQ